MKVSHCSESQRHLLIFIHSQKGMSSFPSQGSWVITLLHSHSLNHITLRFDMIILNWLGTRQTSLIFGFPSDLITYRLWEVSKFIFSAECYIALLRVQCCAENTKLGPILAESIKYCQKAYLSSPFPFPILHYLFSFSSQNLSQTKEFLGFIYLFSKYLQRVYMPG